MSLDEDLRKQLEAIDPELLNEVEQAIEHISLISKSTDTIMKSTGITKEHGDLLKTLAALKKKR